MNRSWPYEARRREVIDLGGRTVIPGLNDSHMHPIRGGLNYNMELRWDGVPSLADALRMLKEQAARTPPPQWVRVVGGWTEFQFAERRMPTLEEINGRRPTRRCSCCTFTTAPSRTARRCAPSAIRKTRRRRSAAKFNATNRATPPACSSPDRTPAFYIRRWRRDRSFASKTKLNSTRHFMRELNRFGVTSAIDAGGGFQNYPDDYEVIDELHKRGELTVRVGLQLVYAEAEGRAGRLSAMDAS